MSRDYKSRDYNSGSTKPRGKSGNPFLTGLLVGFLLGIGASLTVVMFIKGDESPFAHQKEVKKSLSERMKEKSDSDISASPSAKDPKATDDKARFDFYTILPGSESKVTAEEETKLKEETAAAVQKSYFLQVGAFQTAVEADNMKAKLALQGFEAVVQTAVIPGKGVWHRVRVGPLNDLDQINKTKSELLTNGFKADLIKVNSENQ